MATIKDVAKHSGLSMATVSKYLNGVKVKEANKRSIDAAISKLGYSPNVLARGLRTGQSHTIGVVIPELTSVFPTTILSHAEDILFDKGYSLVVSHCRSDIERESKAVQTLLTKQVDGIINMPSDISGKHLLPAIEKNIPVVLIDRIIPALASKLNAVLVDSVAAAEDMTQLLIDAGHKDIGILLGPEHIAPFQNRYKGYLQALERNNIAPRPEFIRFASRSTIQMGYDKTAELLSQCRPTALFATNHNMTMGAVMALNDLRLQVPQDIALAAFDDLPASRVIRPKLTLVAQPHMAIAQSISDIMLTAIENRRDDVKTDAVVKVHKAEIRIGESV